MELETDDVSYWRHKDGILGRTEIAVYQTQKSSFFYPLPNSQFAYDIAVCVEGTNIYDVVYWLKLLVQFSPTLCNPGTDGLVEGLLTIKYHYSIFLLYYSSGTKLCMFTSFLPGQV